MTEVAELVTHVATVGVRFRGERGAVGPLTHAQQATLRWSKDLTEGGNHIMTYFVVLPDAVTVDDVTETLAVLLARHETLRTTYRLGSPPVQRVLAAGELPVAVHELRPDAGPETYLEVGGELAAGLREPELGPQDLPLRVAVAVTHGRARLLVLVVSHLAIDYAAWWLLRRQILELVSDPAARQVGPRTHQPLDQAAAERATPERRLRASVRYWAGELRRVPQVLYAVPPHRTGTGTALCARLHSHAAMRALPHIMARTGASVQMVVLAAIVAVLSRRTGQRWCPVQVLHHGRIGRRLESYLGTVVTDVLVVVDAETASLDELVRRTGAASLVAALHNRIGTEAEASPAVAYQRGVAFARDCMVNNVSRFQRDGRAVPVPPPGPLGEVMAALPRTSVHWAEAEHQSERLLFRIMQADEVLRLWLLTGDTAIVPAAELELLLRAVERLLVSAAGDDVDLRDLGAIAGIEPVVRGPGWSYVDSCWVEGEALQRLVREALHPATVGAFVVPDRHGHPEVVAYLDAGDHLHVPGQAHARCMAALPGHPTALAPARYVLCEGAPADPTDLSGWQRQRVLVEGAGRIAPAH